MIGIGPHKADRIDGGRQLVWTPSFERRQIGLLDANRGRDFGEIETERLAPRPQFIPDRAQPVRLGDFVWRVFRKRHREPMEQRHNSSRDNARLTEPASAGYSAISW